MISRRKSGALASALLCVLALSHAATAAATPDAARRELARVLSQEKFRYYEDGVADSAGENSLDRLLKKIDEKVRHFREWLSSIMKATPFLAALIYLLIFAAVAFLVVYIARRIDPRLKGGGPIPGAAGAASLDYGRELRRARDLLEAGNCRESMQSMLGALWLYYNFTRVLAYRGSVTNREYLSRLGGREEYALLRDIVRRGEAAIYAGEELREDECREIYGKIEGIVAR